MTHQTRVCCCRYSAHLAAVAKGLEESQGDVSRALIINLGPPLPQEQQQLWTNLLEPANPALEQPPGLGIAPLSILFTACKAMHSWLTAGPDNFVARRLDLFCACKNASMTSIYTERILRCWWESAFCIATCATVSFIVLPA